MAYLDDLVSIRDNLVAELKAETARRASLGPKPTYSVGGKSVDWTGYVVAMQKLIADQNAFIIAAGADGGLYEEHMRGYS